MTSWSIVRAMLFRRAVIPYLRGTGTTTATSHFALMPGYWPSNRELSEERRWCNRQRIIRGASKGSVGGLPRTQLRDQCE